MAYSLFTKHFNDIKGIDQNANPINRDPDTAESLMNAEFSDNDDLQMRQGVRPAEGTNSNLTQIGRNGLLPYSYSNSSGQAIEELISYSPATVFGSRQADSVFYKRFEGSMRVVYTGAGVATATYLPDGAGNLIFTLKANGVVVLTQGMNQPETGLRLDSLRVAINAIPNFSCILTPGGLVQTAGGALGKTADLVLQAGHTISVGDSISTASGRVQARVTYVNGNNIRWNTTQNDQAFAVNDPIGILNEYAGNLECFPETTIASGNSLMARVTYWGPVYGEYVHDAANLKNAGVMNSATVLDNLFIGIPSYTYTQSQQCGLTVYDGQRQYRSGLPQTQPPVPTASAGAGGLTASSTYQYFYTLQYKNARGQIIESRRSLATAVTLGAGDTSVLLNMAGGTIFWDTNEAYPSQFGVIAGAAANNATHTLTAGQYIQPGDFMYFYDTVTLSTREVVCSTAKTNTVAWTTGELITVDPAIFPIVSGGMTINIWRTKANSALFYFVKQLPISRSYAGPFSFRDIVADTALTAEYIDPPIGSEKEPPPFMRYVASHQGVLVGCNGIADFVPNQRTLATSRVKTEYPNTVFYALADGPWYFPSAYNAFDVPPGTVGTLSAIASDTTSRLAIFKELAIYEAVGDLANNAFSLETISEGDIGCLSHAALVRIKDALIFPSIRGFRLMANGELESEFSKRLLPSFRAAKTASRLANSQPVTIGDGVSPLFERSIGVNDYKNSRYICYVPVTSSALGPATARSEYLETSKIFVYDYLRNRWFDWSVYNYVSNWGGGMAIYRNRFCASQFGPGMRFMERMETGTDYDYADYSDAIRCDWKLSHLTLGEPSNYKAPLRIRIWQFKHGTLPTILRLQDFRNYVATTASTDVVLTYGTPLVGGFDSISVDAKLLPGKFFATQLVFSNRDASGNYIGSRYFGASGYEIVTRVSYDKEDVI